VLSGMHHMTAGLVTLTIKQIVTVIVHIVISLQYIDTTVTQMSEAWEDILLEMDTKLKKLAEDKYVRY